MNAGQPRVGQRKKRVRAILGYTVGIALLVSALGVVAGQADPIAQAKALALDKPIGLASVILVSILIAWSVSLGFWAVTVRYGPILRREMFALICAAWLLNYLPLWPGMFGRLAYHKAVHNIAIRDSIKAVIWANLAMLACAFIATATALTIGIINPAGDAWVWTACATITAAWFAAAWTVKQRHPRRRRRRADNGEMLLICAGFRWLELTGWAIRYWLVLSLIGIPITANAALALAAVPTIIRFVPLAPNGLGVRTWAVGLTIGLLAWLGIPVQPEAHQLDPQQLIIQTMAADLIIFGVEIAIAAVFGSASSVYLDRRRKRLAIPNTDPPMNSAPEHYPA